MTGIGKLLLALNVVLSLAFMALALAVFSTHTNWRTKAQQLETQVASVRAENQAALEEARLAQAAADDSVAKAEDRARGLEGRLQSVQQERDAFEAKNNRLEQELLTQTGIAETKAAEAIFRKEQADEQTAMNAKLRSQVNALSLSNRDLEDALFSKNLEAEEIGGRYEDVLAEVAELRKVLAANNLSTDIDELTAMKEPPPALDGLITEVQKDKTGNVRYVALSIGSDDGVKRGHVYSVVRPASRNQGRADYLGEVEIVDVMNDVSVGQVVRRSKNGIIEVQDNVTSRL